jgi:hypothetical protein
MVYALVSNQGVDLFMKDLEMGNDGRKPSAIPWKIRRS